jgi:tetratricopeptide (TPR) repeat protein
MKAFLSHSHVDAELVYDVARRIGRPFANLDINVFKSPDDLIASMEQAVRDSAVFVYFASRTAMNSTWVNFEVSEARYYQAITRIKKVVIVILDDSLGSDNFPEWMRRSIFVQSKSPGPIARVVRSAIDELVQDQQHAFFVGRARETAELQAAFVPPDTTTHIPIVNLRGLPGVGRRTLLSRIARDSLSLSRLLTVRVEPGDSVQSLTIKLADLVEPIASPDDTLATVNEIRGLSTSAATARFISDVRAALGLHELVVLYDDGGLLDYDGYLDDDACALLRDVARQPDLLLGIISNRRPKWQRMDDLFEVPVVDLGPLGDGETRQLLAFLAKKSGIDLSSQDIADLAGQVRGYPPAALAAVQSIAVYGGGLVLSRARQAGEYQPRPLNRYLRGLHLSASERKILAVLARNSPLPLAVVARFGTTSDDATSALANLIDLSLVMPQMSTPWYRISEPIIDYIERELDPCTIEDYRLIANELDTFLENDRENGQYLDLSRVFYRALMRSGQETRPRAYNLVSDWIRLAESLYHERHYERAKEFAKSAFESRPGVDAISWLIKCSVKLSQFEEAFAYIEKLRTLGDAKESHFLRGFLERHRGNHREAIRYYELARQFGRGGLAIERDLADCYYQAGDLDRAASLIELAQQKQSDNPYVLSLQIKIACRRGDADAARRFATMLEEVDDPTFALHYRSRVELAFGEPERAYEYAKEAAGRTGRPPAEVISNLALCEVITGRLADAERSISSLESLYPTQRADIKLGLRARLAMAHGDYGQALDYVNKLSRPDTPVHLTLRRDALQGLIDHTSLAGEKRRDLQRQIVDISAQLLSKYGEVDWQVEPD